MSVQFYEKTIYDENQKYKHASLLYMCAQERMFFLSWINFLFNFYSGNAILVLLEIFLRVTEQHLDAVNVTFSLAALTLT
jgi:hypothetical protein